MALHDNFEGLRSLILYRSPLPSIDSVVSELMAKKVRLQSYSKKKIIYTSNAIYTSKPLYNNQNMLYIRVAFNECSFWK